MASWIHEREHRSERSGATTPRIFRPFTTQHQCFQTTTNGKAGDRGKPSGRGNTGGRGKPSGRGKPGARGKTNGRGNDGREEKANFGSGSSDAAGGKETALPETPGTARAEGTRGNGMSRVSEAKRRRSMDAPRENRAAARMPPANRRAEPAGSGRSEAEGSP